MPDSRKSHDPDGAENIRNIASKSSVERYIAAKLCFYDCYINKEQKTISVRESVMKIEDQIKGTINNIPENIQKIQIYCCKPRNKELEEWPDEKTNSDTGFEGLSCLLEKGILSFVIIMSSGNSTHKYTTLDEEKAQCQQKFSTLRNYHVARNEDVHELFEELLHYKLISSDVRHQVIEIAESLSWRLSTSGREDTDFATCVTLGNCTRAMSQTSYVISGLKSTSSIFNDDTPATNLDERKLKVCHSKVVKLLEILENKYGWRKYIECTFFYPGHWSQERKLSSRISKNVILCPLSTAENNQWRKTISNGCAYITIMLGRTNDIDDIHRFQSFLHLRKELWNDLPIVYNYWYEFYSKNNIKTMTEKMASEGKNLQRFEFLRATSNGEYFIPCPKRLNLAKSLIGQHIFLNEIPIVDCVKLPCIFNTICTLKEYNRKQSLFERVACFSFEHSRISFDIKMSAMQAAILKELNDWLYLEETIKIRNEMNDISKNLFRNVHENVYTNRCQLCSKDDIETLVTCSRPKNISKIKEIVLCSRQALQEYCAENPSNIPLYNKTGKGAANRAKNLDDTFPFNSRPKHIKDEHHHDEVKISDLIIFRKSGPRQPRLLSRVADILVEFLAKFLLMYFFVSSFGSKTVNGEYCGISRASMEIVDSCPVNQAKWAQRSAEKNCFSYFEHFNCSQPEKYVYHCVIDHFIREKIEICALESYINLGYCAEYDTIGELIQANYDAKCHQCPMRYLSSEAYKFQECYNMTKIHGILSTEACSSLSDVTTSTRFTTVTNTTATEIRDDDYFMKYMPVILLMVPVSLLLAAYIFVVKRTFCISKCRDYKSKKDSASFSDLESSRSPGYDLNDLETNIRYCESENAVELIDELDSSISLENKNISHDSRSTEKMFNEPVIVVEQEISDYYKLVPSGQCDSSYADTTRYMDDCYDAPVDISVREKEPFLANYMDEEYQNMKAEATRKLNLAMLNLAIYAEKDGDILLALLQDDEYKTIFKEIETCDGTQITCEKIELLEHYAEKVECIVNDF